MNPIERLKSDHRLIERVLCALECIAERGGVEGNLDGPAAGDALHFLCEFSNRCHKGKEERHLFAMMEWRGFPRETGPVALVRREHEEIRGRLRAMAEIFDAAVAGDRNALDQFAGRARAFGDTIRQHMAKEENILFPLAESVMSEQDARALEMAFDRIEREELGADAHRELTRLAEELGARFPPPPPKV
jgi:hemerythrin-like domain-containing protein